MRGDRAWVREHRVRSGDEPVHARSPLRMRLTLAVFGLANGIAGVVVFLLLGVPALTAVFAALIVIALVNVVVVVGHIRAGPHYQPGRDIPPYRPVEPLPRPAPPPRKPVSGGTRRRRYVVAMSVCVVLLALAWGWVRLYSVTAAVIMSAVAALIPPVAAIAANADSPILREDEQDPDRRGRGPRG